MTREKMFDAVVKKFGFESKFTRWFFEMAEIANDKQLEYAFECLEAIDVFEDEDED